jgi:3-hydroxybutyryl-CoA dehydrogenase
MTKNTHIGVIGAGVMGRGVAFQFAKYNFKVVLIDLSDEILEEAKTAITTTARSDRFFHKGDYPTVGNVLDQITFTKELNALKTCDFIVENIIEDKNAKEKLYDQLKPLLKVEAIVAVNTSCIPITPLSERLSNPERVLGIHFMNPVNMKPTVEMIRGKNTSETTIENAQSLLASVNMKGIVVNDAAGFVSNRISHLYFNEAAQIVKEGTATAAQVDEIFKSCFGHKMGPLETADLIGLDTVLDSLKVLEAHYKQDKFKPAPLLLELVEKGDLGRKSGKGFHNY